MAVNQPRVTPHIPRIMSTQHPDNAIAPPFAGADEILSGEEEIIEAFHVFSRLGFDEQMWDYEGKDVDADVVMKLLSTGEHFFHQKRLGRDLFLTLRIPNPHVEVGMRKKAQEALHNIATSFDLAQQFYGDLNEPPVFEVILPFTESEHELFEVYNYYRSIVAGGEDDELLPGVRVKDWVGDIHPKRINVIPLVEDRENLLRVDELVERYLQLLDKIGERPSYLRVFIARSDPALNYGFISAVLLAKLALQKLEALAQRTKVAICPILGVGGAPFRGNFRPPFVHSVLQEYPSVQTFTAQSSFKYDHSMDEVRAATQQLIDWRPQQPTTIDEETALSLINRFTTAYQRQVEQLAPLINTAAALVPARRARRLHIGLYGYSRNIAGAGMSNGVSLPRAIAFCAGLYSIGLPPELFGLDALNKDDWRLLEQIYPHVHQELAVAGLYANAAIFRAQLGDAFWKAAHANIQSIDGEHSGLSSLIYDRLNAKYDLERTKQMAVWAGQVRGFLG